MYKLEVTDCVTSRVVSTYQSFGFCSRSLIQNAGFSLPRFEDFSLPDLDRSLSDMTGF